jgi:hypothetical protein
MTQPGEVPSTRRALDDEAAVREKLGLLHELAGTWKGRGFSLIARPNFHDKANLYLQLNQTDETLTVTPIGSAIPNRGFGQNDIELFGLSYLQEIYDQYTGCCLHLEPGLWITQPSTTFPPEYPPPGGSIIARMAAIPHGSAALAQGNAIRFTGTPTLSPQDGTQLQAGTQIYHGSVFRSFNSTPFLADPLIINAHGSSEEKNRTQIPFRPFDEYNLSKPASQACPRTPFGTNPPERNLPPQIKGIDIQDVINDPIRLLQAVIEEQAARQCTFKGVALNIATQDTVAFWLCRNSPPKGPIVNARVKGAAGGIENILFLEGRELAGGQAPNAQTALVYATFWIEEVTDRRGRRFMQLQYAQMAVLRFPIFQLLNPPGRCPGRLVNLGWPHISVATLRKAP